MKLQAESLLKRIEKARADKSLWESLLRDCYKFALPEGNTFDSPTPGQSNMIEVLDSTAINAVELYATKMVMQLIPPNRNWIELEAGSAVPQDQKAEINKLLGSMTEILFEHIRNSNLISQAIESFKDASISTGALIQEHGDMVNTFLNYRAVPARELMLERTNSGRVENVFRELKAQAGMLKGIWPKAKWPADIEKLMVEKPTSEIDVYEGEIKQDGEFYSFVMCKKSKTIVHQEKLKYPNWIIFRERTMAGQSWGRGRVMRCIHDIKTLNKMTETKLASDAAAIPMFTAVDDGIFNTETVRFDPFAVIPVDNNSNDNPTLRPLQANMSGLSYLGTEIDRRRYDLKEMLLGGAFGNIEETPVRTATEMSLRKSESDQVVAGSTGNFLTEFVKPLIEGAVARLQEVGQLAKLEVDGKTLKVRYMSPAARTQDADELMNLVNSVNVIMQMPEQSVNKVDWGSIPEFVFEKNDVPLKLIKSQEQIQREQMQQQMQMQQMMQAEADAKGSEAMQKAEAQQLAKEEA